MPENMNNTTSSNYKFSTILQLTLLVVILIRLFAYLWRRRHFYIASWKLNGPIALPLIGNGLLTIGTTNEMVKKLVYLYVWYTAPIRIWLGPIFCVLCTTPEEIDRVLHSSDAIQKSKLYRFLRTVRGGIFNVEDSK